MAKDVAIAPGDLNRRCELQRNEANEQRPDGSPVTPNWVTYDVVWVKLEPFNGRERWEADRQRADVTHRVELRYRSDVRPQHRLRRGTRVFEITSVVDVQDAHVKLELLCVETVL